MPRHSKAIDLTRPFVESADRICKKRAELRNQIDATLTELLLHPDAPGLHREPIECHWTQNLWSCRVSSSIRLLEEEPPSANARAMHVGMHDAAYRWARLYRGGGGDEIVDSLQQSEHVEDGNQRADPQGVGQLISGEGRLRYLGPAQLGEDDYSCIPVENLCKLGLSREDAEHIRSAPVSAYLSSYLADADLIKAIDDTYLEYAILAPAQDASDDGMHTTSIEDGAPMPIPMASENDVITITAPGQFRRMMEIGLERYMTTLTEQQQELAHTDQRGLLVVQGSGGSGKTTVAVHRLRYLADRITMQPALQMTCARRVLYLCYNRTLADVARQMLTTLYGGQPPEHIDVYNIHQWAKTYLERHGILSGHGHTDFTGFVANRLTKHEASFQIQPDSARLSARFIAEEITEVIIGRGLDTEEAYLNAGREGRKSRLSQADRRFIWNLYEERQRTLEQDRQYDVSMLPSLALKYLSDDATFTPYEAVIVDEAQDLTPIGLRLATQLAGGQFACMTIFADAAQSIYRSGFRWKQAELNPRGRQLQKLAQNHRNTVQIWDMASSFLGRGEGPEEPDGYVIAERPTSRGTLPVLLTCPDARTEVREVVARIQAQIADGVPAQNIGVLSGKRSGIDDVVRALRDVHIASEVHDPSTQSHITITHPSVKVLTMHNAKGLDFPHVYLVGLTEEDIPGTPDDSVADDVQRDGREMQRRLLYTAMIRAGQTLVMTTIAGKELLLLADVSDELCLHVRANTGEE